MDEQTRQGFARRAAPYGLALVPETHRTTRINEQYEWAIQQQWQDTCERHGAAILGTWDVPTQPYVVQLDGVRWEVGLLGTDERVVLDDVFHRVRALEVAGVPFDWWLWGEELPQRPHLRPLSEPASAAASRPAPARRVYTWGKQLEAECDPLLIGVIRTAVGRSLFVLIGRWYH